MTIDQVEVEEIDLATADDRGIDIQTNHQTDEDEEAGIGITTGEMTLVKGREGTARTPLTLMPEVEVTAFVTLVQEHLQKLLRYVTWLWSLVQKRDLHRYQILM